VPTLSFSGKIEKEIAHIYTVMIWGNEKQNTKAKDMGIRSHTGRFSVLVAVWECTAFVRKAASKQGKTKLVRSWVKEVLGNLEGKRKMVRNQSGLRNQSIM